MTSRKPRQVYSARTRFQVCTPIGRRVYSPRHADLRSSKIPLVYCLSKLAVKKRRRKYTTLQIFIRYKLSSDLGSASWVTSRILSLMLVLNLWVFLGAAVVRYKRSDQRCLFKSTFDRQKHVSSVESEWKAFFSRETKHCVRVWLRGLGWNSLYELLLTC